MTTKVFGKGQIVLPAEIRDQDDIRPGERFDVERIERGEYRLVRRQPTPNDGLTDWLLAWPEKGYFVPIESESTSHVVIAAQRQTDPRHRSGQDAPVP